MWSHILTEASTQQNFNFGFSTHKSDILIHLSQWQYWWWFWFAIWWSFYLLVIIRTITKKTFNFNVTLNTSLRGKGKWGDFLIALIPLSWCCNILINSNFILRMIEWQNETSIFTIRIQGKQWYWIYKYDPSTAQAVYYTPKNLGHNRWRVTSGQESYNSDTFYQAIHLAAQVQYQDAYSHLLKKDDNTKSIISNMSLSSEPELFGSLWIQTNETRTVLNYNKNLNKVYSELVATFKKLEAKEFTKEQLAEMKYLRNRKLLQLEPLITDGSDLQIFYLPNRDRLVIVRNHLIGAPKAKKFFDDLRSEHGGRRNVQIQNEEEVGYLLGDATIRWKKSLFFLKRWKQKNMFYSNAFTMFQAQESSSFWNLFTRRPLLEKTSTNTELLSKNKNSIGYYDYLKIDDVSDDSKNVRQKLVTQPFRLVRGIINAHVVDILQNSKINPKDFKKLLFLNTKFYSSGEAVQDKTLSPETFWGFRQKRRKKFKDFYFKEELIYDPITFEVIGFKTQPGNLGVNNTIVEDTLEPQSVRNYRRSARVNKSRAEVLPVSLTKRLLRTKRTLILPAHINLTLITNSYDVVHSWFVPGLGLKIDCVPGRSTHHSLYIDNIGFYYGQCAEICGRYHHHMPIRVCALPFDQFVVWWQHKATARMNRTCELSETRPNLIFNNKITKTKLIYKMN